MPHIAQVRNGKEGCIRHCFAWLWTKRILPSAFRLAILADALTSPLADEVFATHQAFSCFAFRVVGLFSSLAYMAHGSPARAALLQWIRS